MAFSRKMQLKQACIKLKFRSEVYKKLGRTDNARKCEEKIQALRKVIGK